MAVLEGNVAFANLDEHEEYQGQSTGKYSLVLSLEDAQADELANKGVKLREYEGVKQRKFSTKYEVPMFDADGKPLTGSSIIDARFKDFDTTKITGSLPNKKVNHSVYDDSIDRMSLHGARFGLTPEFSSENGFFVIDEAGGTINFSNQLVEKVITLRYISDSLGTDEEIKIHKFAEDAIYKYITHAIGSAKANMPEYIINRFRKEKRAAMRNAKLRLANLKTEEMTQVMRGKAKMIK